ncbi:inositol monophosphatase [Roseomonas sp. GC11]|uniref:inositol monophosphatase family protein n=1 Tax=Roseomonas sp. GC11 TaxID=2950546 RepID=UPI002108A445|nr:inositol monophosphatase [Roseomonas sp. GC11]MCQ4162386.1 inositol monophosphatase [Roseomonas sp. GC11]
MSDEVAARLALAEALAREAGAMALRMRDDLGPVESKSPIDFCTAADHAVEAMIRARIAAAFGDAVIGEEEGGEAADSVWVVDPIDGTANFIHGGPRWCISLAWMRRGRVELGVIYQPREGRLFSARRGQGAFLNGARLSVSHLAHGAAPLVEMGWSERRPLASFTEALHRLTEQRFEFRRHGSGALGLADVAAGLNDAYAELHINAWDVLAGLLLVREAGGVVNDFLANDGLTRGNPVLAATPEIAPRLSALLGIPLPEPVEMAGSETP